MDISSLSGRVTPTDEPDYLQLSKEFGQEKNTVVAASKLITYINDKKI